MKIAVVCTVFCIAVPPVASAQTGGYPASPSHGVVGTKADGTPRYGSEPGSDANRSSGTVGNTGSNTVGKAGANGAGDAAQQQHEMPKRGR